MSDGISKASQSQANAYQTGNQSADKTGQIKTEKPVTGTGMMAAGGKAPDVATALSMGAMMGSIMAMMPQISGQSLDVKLMEVVNKMKDSIDSSEKGKIEVDRDKQRAMIGEKRAKLEEAEKKIQEAIDKRNSASIWDKIKIGFQMLGALITIALGAVMIGLTPLLGPAAAIAGGLVIAGGVCMMVLAIDSIVAASTKGQGGAAAGMGIAGHFASLFTDDKELLGKIDLGFKLSVTALSVIFGIAGSLIMPNPAGMASIIQGFASAAAGVATATIGVATATGDVVTGVQKYEASKLEAGAKEKQAEGKETEALMKVLEDAIDQALKRLMGAGDRFAAMLDSISEAAQDRANTMSRAKFA